ncbi:MAG TPA: methionyl-tRNA formyltransferase [Thermomicrobiales bacterium]|nr:methionyl-tRNA formyltransferase [Thermomicrobiales bacterium]
MAQSIGDESETSSWRVVVFTMIADGMVYRLVEQLLEPFGHRVVGVVTTPGPKLRRSDDYLSVVGAVRPGVDVIVSTHPSRWAGMLVALNPDLIISCGFPYRIPADVISLPRLGAINVHPSLLPRHRGPWPLHWTFRAGDAEAGMTIHRLTSDFDEGPILAQGRVPVTDDDDGVSLMAKLTPLAANLLIESLPRIAAGDPGDAQEGTGTTEAGIFEEAWRMVDWDRTARDVHNQIRSWTGVAGGPCGAFAMVDGERYLVTRARLEPSGLTGSVPPGSVVRRDAGEIIVQCGDGRLVLVEWEPAT